ncbi:MAG: IS110 family transposase [Gallionella sp.]|nr:IS110 family transposase [Gallionella sp.]NCP79823.1 IS110 family transposase [Gallionella sp.]PIR09214.1 MAG: hypothetical protein COV51_05515 [Gallionellaceae bacterium CG11_big_fil_rev_8_21_14_0_20_60_62]PJC05146.1 MAG: hypothetical protein CO069_01135 [Gallionellaceae bacterium CG_4_9_14_0_8_um_filter_60_335]
MAAYLGLVPVERQSGSLVLGRARLSKAGPARIRALLCTWPLWWRRAIIRTSRPSMNACSPVASPRCLRSAPRCASWRSCASVCSKHANLICTIRQNRLTGKTVSTEGRLKDGFPVQLVLRSGENPISPPQ